MKHPKHLAKRDWKSRLRRMEALLLVLCLVLTSFNLGSFASLADSPAEFVLGENGNVTAVLKNGVLTVSGNGDTYDYSLENPSPLTEYADEIHTLVIEEGITRLGSYLFYGCGELSGELILPERLVSLGDCVFSGESLEQAPKFRLIDNRFEEAQVVIPEEPAAVEEPEQQREEETPPEALPSEDAAGEEVPKPEDGAEAEVPPEEPGGSAPGPDSPAPDNSAPDSSAPDNSVPDSSAPESGEPEPPAEAPADSIQEQEPAELPQEPSEEPPAAESAVEPPVKEPAASPESPEEKPAQDGTKDTVEILPGKVPMAEAPAYLDSGPPPDQSAPKSEEGPSAAQEPEPGNADIDADAGADGSEEPPKQPDEASVEIQVITEQRVGRELFFPGQTGVFRCGEANEAFAEELESAGYSRVLDDMEIILGDGDGGVMAYSCAVTEQGLFLPHFSDTGLAPPAAEAGSEPQFMGWREAAGESGPEEPVYWEAYSFYEGESGSFTAVFETVYHTLVQQTISTQTEDGLLVEVSGRLPEGARVLAQPVAAESAAGLAGDYVPDPGMVVAALDISILEGEAKFQPSDYGENVTVQIRNLSAAPTQEQSIAVLHIKEEAAAPGVGVEVIASQPVEGNAVAFDAERFSVYIVTVADNHTVTFTGDGYTLANAGGSAFSDEDPAKEGIQITTTGAFFQFQILPNQGKILGDVTVKAADAAQKDAYLYGPNESGVYRVSNVTADQTVTLVMAQAHTVTYYVNGGQGTEPKAVAAPAGDYRALYPAEIGFTALPNYHFTGWNTNPDGTGTDYPAGGTVTLAADLALYATWSNTTAPFAAKLYNSAALSEADCTELTEGGAEARPWEYEGDGVVRYLKVAVDQAGGSTLTIELPVGMQIYGANYTPAGGNIGSAVFTKLSGLSGGGGQGTGTYSNPNTGTLAYTFSPSAGKEEVTVPVTFDQTVWDRAKLNGNLTGSKPPIRVTLETAGSQSYTKTISKVQAAKDYQGRGMYLSTEHVPKYVPLDVETPISFADIGGLGYMRSVTVEYILPHKTAADGTVSYAEYKREHDGSDGRTASTVQNPGQITFDGQSVDSSDPTRVIYTWENCYFPDVLLHMAPVVAFPKSLFQDGDAAAIGVNVTGVGYTGSVVRASAERTMRVSAGGAAVTPFVAESVVSSSKDASVADHLGCLTLKNDGLETSGELKVTYIFDSETIAGQPNAMNVSAFAVPNGEGPFTAECTLVDASGSNPFTQTMSLTSKSRAEGALLLARDAANQAGKTNPDEWYLKQVVYSISSIPKNTALGTENAPKRFGGAGNWYGTVSGNAYTTMKVEGWDAATSGWAAMTYMDDAGIPQAFDVKAETVVSASRVLTTYIDTLRINGAEDGVSATVSAGESLELEAKLVMHDYPYWSSQYAQDPMLCLVLPNGIRVASDSITAAWSDSGTDAITPQLTAEPRSDGKTVYRIAFNGTAPFGGPRLTANGLEAPGAGRAPVVKMRLSIDAEMDSVSLPLAGSVFVTEEHGSVKIGEGTGNDAPDVYDLNQDGQVSDFVGAYAGNGNMELSVKANANHLSFTAAARLADDPLSGWKTGENNPVYLSNEHSKLEYRVTLSNASGGFVAREDFYYYIPVPKAGAATHEHMSNGKGETPDFDLALAGPVAVAGNHPGIYDVRYSLDATNTAGSHYYNNGEASFASDGVGYATYYTAEEITKKGAWQQVRMCKIIAAADYVPSDTQDTFTCTLAYSGGVNGGNAGDTAVWAACGYQKYTVDGQGTGTHTPTALVSAMLRLQEAREVTLTADPGTGSNVFSAELTQDAFGSAKAWSLQSITPYNVTLEPEATVNEARATAPSSVADNNFAISIGLDDNGFRELADGTGQLLGSTAAGQKSTLKLRMTYYNRLSDAATMRRVVVVLGDGKGVELTLTIQIERVPMAVTDPKVAVDAGKRYALISGGDSATITQNSAATAQFVYSLTPSGSQGQGQSLSLATGTGQAASFPKGAAIAMLDFSGGSPGYYYYNVTADGQASIPLGDFYEMGGQSKRYGDPAAGAGTEALPQKLVFVLDFANGPLAPGTYQLKLEVTGSGGAAVATDTQVGLIITEARTFALSATAAATMSESLPVSGRVTVNGVTGADTANQHKKMALEVKLLDGVGTQLAPPDGAVITMGGEAYPPVNGIYLLPLGELATRSFQFTFDTPHTNLASGNYRLQASLLLSATSDNAAPCGGSRLENAASVAFAAAPPVRYALSVKTSEEKRIFTQAEAEQISFTMSTNEAAMSRSISLEVQKKSGEVYVRQLNLIASVSNADGTQWLGPANGVVTSAPRTGQNTAAVLRLNAANLTAGTYRLVFQVQGPDGEAFSVPYHLVVL